MKDDELKRIKEHIQRVDEDYLILIANRGLYKRALKERENRGALPFRLDKELTVEPEEGILCRIGKDGPSSTCSCPSLKVCKHLLVSLLFLKENFAQVFGEEEGETTFDGTLLLALTAEEMVRKVGENRYNDTLFRLSFGGEVQFKEARFLEVTFPEEQIKLKISPEKPWKESLCSCKKENCPHLLEALIRYQLIKGEKSLADFPYRWEKEIDGETVEKVRLLWEEILELGLSRLPRSITSQVERLCLACHNAGLSALEKGLRRLSGELEAYFAKDPLFSLPTFRNVLGQVYLLSCQLLKSGDGKLIIEQTGHRSSYVTLPALRLCGLGTAAWETKSGYRGLTTYFLDTDSGRWYSYTQSRPSYLDGQTISFDELYEKPPWKNPPSMARIARSEIHLRQPQINRKGRLSGSEETTVTVFENTDPKRWEKYIYSDWLSLLKELRKKEEMGRNPVLLKTDRWGPAHFEEKTQRFTQPLYDGKNRALQISLDFSGPRAGAVHTLEKLSAAGPLPSLLLGRVTPGEKHLLVEPLVLYGEEGSLISLTMGEL
ncbi:MAG: hypothetical protein PQJ60_08450 [Spirochaetales bacterium]|nr:hypothetical protein [Spirochaetales bacterium]